MPDDAPETSAEQDRFCELSDAIVDHVCKRAKHMQEMDMGALRCFVNTCHEAYNFRLFTLTHDVRRADWEHGLSSGSQSE